jgi:hypothetical protein
MDDNELKKLLQINNDWIQRNYSFHETKQIGRKIKIEYLSIKLIGNAYDLSAFIVELNNIIPKYVKGGFEYAEAYQNSPEYFDNFTSEARRHFGNIENKLEGKYGELILYSLVEGILNIPMIGNKMLTNFNDQAKGSDGVFLGSYQTISNSIISSILIGESKTIQKQNDAITKAISSIIRFIDEDQKQLFSSDEFIIAKKMIFKNKPEIEKYIYECLTITSEEHKKRSKVYPIFIMYELSDLENINQADSPNEAQIKLNTLIESKAKSIESKISEEINSNSKIINEFLHFFIIPIPNLQTFRSQMHQQIHNLR